MKMTRKLINKEVGKKVKNLVEKAANKKNEEAILSKGERFFQRLVEGHPGIFCVIDGGKNILLWNKSAEHITGYSKNEISQMDPLDLFRKNERTIVTNKIKETLKNNQATLEADVLLKNGDTIAYHLYGIRVTVDGKKYIIVVGTDISEHRRAEDTLREYQLAVDGSKELIFVVDDKYRYILVNEAYLKQRGSERHEILGRTIDEIVGKKIFEDTVKENLDSCLQGKQVTCEMHHFFPETGSRNLEVNYYPLKNEEKRVSRVVIVVRDVTSQKSAEEALRKAYDDLEKQKTALLKSNENLKKEVKKRVQAFLDLHQNEEKYRLIFENIQDVYYEVSVDGVILEVSPSIKDISRYKRENLIGKSLYDIYADPNERDDFLSELKKNGKVSDYEVMLKDKDGSQRCCSVSARLEKDHGGSPAKCIGVMHDVSKRKRAEQELLKSEDRLVLENIKLQESNTALKVLLKQREEDKIEIEKNVLMNINELILPYLKKIKTTQQKERQKAYADIIESNLNEIISRFTHRLSSEYTDLTPMEIKVAQLVKQGNTTKAIADLLHLSQRTIESHRNGLRKKLGLTSDKKNLRSYLLCLE
jgi:PAS domain S-box-containing protein